MDGLAKQMGGQPAMAQPQGQPPMQGQGMRQGRGQGRGQGMGQNNIPTVEEVVALLMQGADPQKLIEMGVPQELIMQAIQIIEQQLAAQGQSGAASSTPAPVQQEPGLAAQSAGMM